MLGVVAGGGGSYSDLQHMVTSTHYQTCSFLIDTQQGYYRFEVFISFYFYFVFHFVVCSFS